MIVSSDLVISGVIVPVIVGGVLSIIKSSEIFSDFLKHKLQLAKHSYIPLEVLGTL